MKGSPVTSTAAGERGELTDRMGVGPPGGAQTPSGNISFWPEPVDPVKGEAKGARGGALEGPAQAWAAGITRKNEDAQAVP